MSFETRVVSREVQGGELCEARVRFRVAAKPEGGQSATKPYPAKLRRM